MKEQVHTISRLAARAVQAAEQGYLDSAASKCKEAERNGMLLDAQVVLQIQSGPQAVHRNWLPPLPFLKKCIQTTNI